MKVLLSYLWPMLSIIMLAMHFYRNGNSLALLLCLFLLPALMVRRPWMTRILQICLVLGAAEWARTTFILIHARVEAGAPFLRLALILVGIALFTLASSLIVPTPTGSGSLKASNSRPRRLLHWKRH